MGDGDAHHPPPAERRKRLNLWLIFLAVLVLIALAALGLVLLVDDDENSGASPTTTTATAQPTTPEQVALAVYKAWQANDRAGATQYASPQAIEQLFSVLYVPVQTLDGPRDPLLEAHACVHVIEAMRCTWTGELERIVMVVRNAPGLRAFVVEVQRTGG